MDGCILTGCRDRAGTPAVPDRPPTAPLAASFPGLLFDSPMLTRLFIAIFVGLAVGALLGWLGALIGLPGAVVGGIAGGVAVAIVHASRPRDSKGV